MYLCIKVFKHTCISKSRLINDKQEGNIPNLGISDHSQVVRLGKMWKNIGQYTYIRAMTCPETPKHLTNFNHCMMTINSRGLAGGRGGVFRTAVGMNSIYCSYFFRTISYWFPWQVSCTHSHVSSSISLLYSYQTSYRTSVNVMLIRTRAWKKFEAILKIAANQTAIKQTTTTTYRHIAHWNCTQTNRTQITFVQHLKKRGNRA